MRKVDEKILHKGEWLTLVATTFENGRGEHYVWESVRRSKEAAGVVVIAKLVPSNRFVLIKQFRPVLENFVLGFPSGLADNDPQHALVELKEETGYTGKIIEASPVLKSNAGIVHDSGMAVYVEVDETLAENENPEQELEPSEIIDVVLVSKDNMKEFLLKEHEAGTYIASNLWYLFILSDLIH